MKFCNNISRMIATYYEIHFILVIKILLEFKKSEVRKFTLALYVSNFINFSL
jgi:hypothetical protein